MYGVADLVSLSHQSMLQHIGRGDSVGTGIVFFTIIPISTCSLVDFYLVLLVLCIVYSKQ